MLADVLQQIRSISQDLRLNPLNSVELLDLKLRMVEDLCTKTLIQIREQRNSEN